MPDALDFADDRQNVGGELIRLGLRSFAHALYGAGGIRGAYPNAFREPWLPLEPPWGALR